MIAIILYYYTYLIIYREKTKQEEGKEERENQGEGCRRYLRQFLASLSAPSDAFTVHTIASRSPLRPLVSALRERDGRPPRPILGDAIDTTSPHLAADRPASGQRLDGLPSSPPRPRSLPSCGEVGQSKRNRKRRN